MITSAFLGDILDRVGHGAGAKGHSQTCYGCGVADTGTVIGVVGSEAGTNHLLYHVDIFVRGTGTGKTGQRLWTVFLLDLHKLGSNQIQCFIPGCSLKFSGFFIFDQRDTVILAPDDWTKSKLPLRPLTQSSPLLDGPLYASVSTILPSLTNKIILAAGCTMWTGGQHFLCRSG